MPMLAPICASPPCTGNGSDRALMTFCATLVAGGGVRTVQMVKKESHAFLTATLACTLLVMLGPTAILLNLMQSGGGNYPDWISGGFLRVLNPIVESVVGLF